MCAQYDLRYDLKKMKREFFFSSQLYYLTTSMEAAPDLKKSVESSI